MQKIGFGEVGFKEHQNITANERIDYDFKAVEIATKLYAMGEDAQKYLIDRDVLKKDDTTAGFDDFFTEDDENSNDQ